MTNKRVKRLPKIILGQLAVILVIVIIASGLIFYAQGYKINLKNFKVIRTGMILLVTDPTPDHIVINGIEENNTSEYSKTFTSGYYDITISKDKYQNWHRSVFIDPGKLVTFKEIKLFLKDPEVSELTDQSKINFLNTPNSYLAENSTNDLTFNRYEIWVNGSLLTRFSSQINSPMWYPDDDHIVYQIGNEIHVIDKSGYNDTKLVTLSTNNPTRFTIGNKGRELYFLDGESYKIADIR
ncbi:MAG: hypothetical protein WC080_00155 [Patescibacteria group bacterium]|jgi:hypothetical protein